MLKFKLWYKMLKILNPEMIQRRNSYIQSNIYECEKIKKVIGEEEFNRRWGKEYINNLKSDIV